MKLWAFNRRTVDDQTVYVEADTVEQAERMVRAGVSTVTGDCKTRLMTLRRLPEKDEPRQRAGQP